MFNGHLAHFVFIWYIISGFGILQQEKSGNPGPHFTGLRISRKAAVAKNHTHTYCKKAKNELMWLPRRFSAYEREGRKNVFWRQKMRLKKTSVFLLHNFGK
jgi:hypothetical protein